MARSPANRTSALAFDAITVEGALIAPAMLARIAAAEGRRADGSRLRMSRRASPCATRSRAISASARRCSPNLLASATPSTAATMRFVEALLRDVFGFADIRRVGTRTLDERLFAVTLEALGGRVPVVVVPPSDDLDRASDASAQRRVAGARPPPPCRIGSMPSDGALWGLCCNGTGSASCATTPAYTRPPTSRPILRRIFEGEAFADFAALWLLVHASRFGLPARRRPIAPSNAGARPAARRASPRATACATASRRRCSASATASSRIPTMRRCASGCERRAAAARVFRSAPASGLPADLPARGRGPQPAAPAGRAGRSAQALCGGLFRRPRCATAPCAARPGTGTTTAGKGC